MNVADLKDRIIRGTNYVYNDSNYMLSLLNEAVNIMTNDAMLEASQEISVVSGTANYALPANFKSTRALVEGTLDNPTATYSLVAMDELSQGYSLWNGEIVLKPTPNADKTLNLYYYKWATELVEDTDTPDIDSHYHSALASYAIAMILSMPGIEGERNVIDRHFGLFDQATARFKSDISKGKRLSTVRKVENWR